LATQFLYILKSHDLKQLRKNVATLVGWKKKWKKI